MYRFYFIHLIDLPLRCRDYVLAIVLDLTGCYCVYWEYTPFLSQRGGPHLCVRGRKYTPNLRVYNNFPDLTSLSSSQKRKRKENLSFFIIILLTNCMDSLKFVIFILIISFAILSVLGLISFSECWIALKQRARLRLCVLLKKCGSHDTVYGPTKVIQI